MIFQYKITQSLKDRGDKTAIITQGRAISNREILNKANKITLFLLRQQLEKETIVGILVKERSDLICAMIGVANARCVFAPLDGTLPPGRLDAIVQELQPRLIISTITGGVENRPGAPMYIDIEEIQADITQSEADAVVYPAYDAEDSLYVFFTSGSTGTPKGIVGKNCSLLQFLEWEISTFGIDESSRFSQFISPYFDAFLRDVFTPLIAGATICLSPAEDDFFTPKKITEWIDQASITVIHCVPSLFRQINSDLLTPASFPNLKYVLMSGEKINPSELARWYEKINTRIELYNFYGATETTMIRSYYKISPDDVKKSRIPIGFPIHDTELLISKKDFKPCNTLAPGELYIISPYVSKGYLNSPELTGERFIKMASGKIAFKTGDVARRLPDGNIELLGREDRQVKISGMRVELDEIEAVLLKSGYLKNAVVVQRGNDSDVLTAFIQINERHPQPDILKKELQLFAEKLLPSHMLPSEFIIINDFPLLPNGKINYKALQNYSANEETILAPETPIEAKLLEIWKEILGDKPISVDSSFYKIGGNSLRVMNLFARIDRTFHVRIPLSDLFNNATIRKQAEIIRQSGKVNAITISKASKTENYALSSSQNRLFFLHQLNRNSLAYNVPEIVRLKGVLNKEKLQDTFRQLIARHDSLRTCFQVIGGEPRQKIVDQVGFSVEYLSASASKIDTAVKEFIRPFDLEKPPLLRARVIETSENEYILMVDMHHIISDGGSFSVLVKEFMALYNGDGVAPLKLNYVDFAEWMQGTAQQEMISNQKAFWLNEFSGEFQSLVLPTDFQRPLVKNYEGAFVEFELGADETLKLNDIAGKHDATMFMMMLTAFNILLSKLSGNSDIVIGTPTAGRYHPDLENVIGMFVNTLPLRNNPKGEFTVKTFLSEVRTKTQACLENQIYPYEELIDALQVKRDMSRNPLFDAMLAFQNFSHPKITIRDLQLTPFKRQRTVSKFDLTLYGFEAQDKVILGFEYSTQLFKKETIDRFINYFKNVTSAIVEDIDQKIADIEIIGADERQMLLQTYNYADVPYPFDATISHLFDKQARMTPNRIAVKINEETLTYYELSTQVNKLAGLLREHGVKPNQVTAFLTDRSIKTVVGILAILKAGGAYLPIDVDYPQERIAYLIKDSGASVLLTSKDLNIGTYHTTTVYIEDAETRSDEVLEIVNVPSDLCYVIYTSGTTGNPKGVMVEHKNVVRLLFNEQFQFDFNSADVWTMFHSPSFDVSVWELCGSLLFGGTLIVIPKMTARDTQEFLKVLVKENVTVLCQTPSAFYNLVQEAAPVNLPLKVRYVIFAGEALSPQKLRPWRRKYPEAKLINMYGITETTVHSTFKEITDAEIEGDVSNIGKPLPTLSMYIFDQYKHLVPLGVVGELYVGGEGVTRGYLGNKELTATKFIPNPYNPTERLYRSGDLARIMPSGDWEYLGRIDHQVKIRGFRIEPGEIENQVLTHNAVKEAVVIVRQNGDDKYLVCYYTAKVEIDGPVLKTYVSDKLPDYMIPSFFVRLDKFPLTLNGKLDKRALPAPDFSRTENYTSPVNAIEERMVELWSVVLGMDAAKISTTQSFFDLGGNSFKIVRLNSMINETFPWHISITDMFRYTTISALIQFAEGQDTSTARYVETAREEVFGMEDVINSVNV